MRAQMFPLRHTLLVIFVCSKRGYSQVICDDLMMTDYADLLETSFLLRWSLTSCSLHQVKNDEREKKPHNENGKW